MPMWIDAMVEGLHFRWANILILVLCQSHDVTDQACGSTECTLNHVTQFTKNEWNEKAVLR